MPNTTLIVHHTFSALAILINLTRLLTRHFVFHSLELPDLWVLLAILCAATRDALIHVVLTWGTNNISPSARSHIDFTSGEIYRRTIGSKFAIANRPVYNTYLWLLKLVLLDFFCRHFHPTKRAKKLIWWTYGTTFFATWLAALVVGFTECDPFPLYWQVLPAPGKCVEAQTQLIVLGVLNIFTDIMLLLLPLPTLLSLQTPWKRKLRLLMICTLGIFIVAITVIRLPINALNATVQSNRTVWASTELLTAGIVANAPTLYGAVRKWRLRDGVEGVVGGRGVGLVTFGSAGEEGMVREEAERRKGRTGDEDLMLRTEDRLWRDGEGEGGDGKSPGESRGSEWRFSSA
ncbi:unnamed protein product [Zymoseptoria tritici ST99CH_1E4]|uniref:Rhodopsin domain-containing protein n=1 Tax=Zymoseptoria tritici ST99CH_1E4 TaxID=1276532 RepID=A0A2H1GSZ3_ZYMTR|nr:unnamed protein product [Zymoseptoria tritici ST99CH_1E4]